jgi:hypothetical protein
MPSRSTAGISSFMQSASSFGVSILPGPKTAEKGG